jgi:UDP-N-acetylglucosamine 4,6-dehydratase (inverting)
MMKKNNEIFEDKTILITGGTGSFGKEFISKILNTNVKKVIIYSRDEMKQWQMSQKFQDTRLRYFIGCVRDRERLYRAFANVDIVIHAAAMKIVPVAEYNPFECIRTNVIGAMNVMDAAIDCGVRKVVALSTDKACSPVNLYGATKLTSDKIFVSGNHYAKNEQTKFAIVRYGNVMGSRGSVIPFFKSLKNPDYVPITDKRMTRFLISLNEGLELVFTALKSMEGGEIFVKKIPSILITDIAKAIHPEIPIKIIGIRPGEKIHEQMISSDDAPYTYEYDDHYRILPAINNWNKDPKRINGGKLVGSDFVYDSGTNPWFLNSDQFLALLNENV